MSESTPYGAHGIYEPLFVDTEAGFDYSAEALKAIETISYARGSQQHPSAVKETPRLDKWAREDAELKAMLGVDKLPKQGTISSDEWANYSARIARGEQTAKTELLDRLLRYAYGTAQSFDERLESHELTIEDHFQAAVAGMCQAIDEFDPAKNRTTLRAGIQFSVWTALNRQAAKRGLIQFSIPDYELQSKAAKARAKLAQELGLASLADVGLDLVAEAIGVGEEDLERSERAHKYLGYEKLLPEEAAVALPDTDMGQDPFEHVADTMDSENLREVLEGLKLSFRDKQIFQLHNGLIGGERLSFDQLARKFNITTERVRQLANLTLKTLQASPKKEKLRNPSDTDILLQLPVSPLKQAQADFAESNSRIGPDDSHKRTRVFRETATKLSEAIEASEGRYISTLSYFIMQEMQGMANARKSADLKFNRHLLKLGIEYKYLQGAEPIYMSSFVRALQVLQRNYIIGAGPMNIDFNNDFRLQLSSLR